MSFSIKYEQRQDDLYTWDQGRPGPVRDLHFPTPHIHKEMELVFLFKGKTVVSVDSVRHEPEAGDAILICPNQVHSYLTLESETYRLFLIKPELVPELSDALEFIPSSSSVIKGAANDPVIRPLYERLVSVCASREELPHKKHLERGYCLALLAELISRMELQKSPRTDSDALRSLISYCTKHYKEDLSLSALEEQLHLNRYYISHLFSGKLGLRLNDYVNSLRITEACRRLIHTEESITDISYRVGFNTLRTFNRAFMKQMKLAPSEYRRQNRSALAAEKKERNQL